MDLGEWLINIRHFSVTFPYSDVMKLDSSKSSDGIGHFSVSDAKVMSVEVRMQSFCTYPSAAV